MARNKKTNKIDLKKREALKKFAALGVGSVFGILLSKLALGQEFGHTGDEILSGKIAQTIISGSNSASTATEVTFSAVGTWTDLSGATVSLTLTNDSLVFACISIPGITGDAGDLAELQLLIDGTIVAYGNNKHVSDSGGYVINRTQWNTVTLEGHKSCSSGARTAKIQYKGTGTINDGANTYYIYIIAIPG